MTQQEIIEAISALNDVLKTTLLLNGHAELQKETMGKITELVKKLNTP